MSLFTPVPTNMVLTSGANSALTWTNAMSVSSISVSTLGASNLSVSTLTTSSSVTASTLTSGSISSNTLTLSLTNASTQNTQIYQVATTNPTTSYTVIQASHVSTGTTNNALALNPSGGNVGVGTTAPTSALQVSASNANATTTITVSNPSNANTGFGAQILFDNFSGNATLGSIAALRTNNTENFRSYMAFSVNNTNLSTLTERMRITADGNVGIGDTAPSQLLTIGGTGTPAMLIKSNSGGTSGNTASIYLSNAAYNMGTIQAIENANGYGGTWGSELTFATNYNNAMNERMRITARGNVGIGTTTPDSGYTTTIPNAKLSILNSGAGANVKSRLSIGGGASHYAAIEGEHTINGATTLSFMTCLSAVTNSGNPETRMFIANDGKVGIGTTNPSANLSVVGTSVANTELINCLTASNGNKIFAVYASANTQNSGWNTSDTILRVSKDFSNNRSINASGTFNASGADYAEYMTKDSDFSSLKGDLLGVLPSGKLTNQFDDAIHFLLKSTNPCMVGGDVWGSEAIVGEKPKEPENATEEEKAAHAVALAAWEARLEAERQKVDRMAFAGQVPVNILGATPGNYIIPLRNADGSIGIAAVSSADMTFSQYQSAVGRVISILEDGRANVIVKAV
jgi:hypothetical protein